MSVARAPAKKRRRSGSKGPQRGEGGSSGHRTAAPRVAPGPVHSAAPAVGLGLSIQPKLEVSPPDDDLEKEADQVADTVSRMPESDVGGSPGEEEEELPVQAKADVGTGDTVVQRFCTDCAREASPVQRQPEPEDEGEPEGPVQRQSTPAEEGEEEVAQRQPVAGEESEDEIVQRQPDPEEGPVEEEEPPVQRQPVSEEEPEDTVQRQTEEEPVEEPETVQRMCAECEEEMGGDGGPGVQPQMAIDEPGDTYEREADTVADQVMRQVDAEEDEESATLQTKPIISRVSPAGDGTVSGAGLQRKTELPSIPEVEGERPDERAPPEGESAEGPGGGPGSEASPEGEAEGEGKGEEGKKVTLPPPAQPPVEEEAPPLQMRSDGTAGSSARSSSSPTGAVQDTLRSTRGGGRPISPGVRSEMERGFGRDLSGVRIHTDSAAGQMNRDLRARAFTHRRHIYFAPGEYRPGSPGGKRLLAHELTHTIQQGAVSDRIQRFTAPPQEVTVEGRAERPDDGAEVEGRMNEKITDDENVQSQEDLSEEERREKEEPDRGEVRRESGEIESSGESKPSVDRGAEAEKKASEQKQQIEKKASESGEEAPEGEADGEEEETELSDAEAAAQRALAAEAAAQSVEIPAEPQPFRHPRIEAPVDSAGETLPRNSQVDTQVRGLAYIGEMLREKGYEMKRHAADQEIGAYGVEAVLEREREDLANAREGTALIEAHTEARKEIAETSRQAHSESVERQQFVAEKAPDLASKADEGKADSGALADEARSKADRSKGEIPDDPDARADAQKQSGEMESSAEGAESMDQAIVQTGERARQYEQDAATAAEENEQSESRITETEDVIAQTETRVSEMQASNEDSQAQIDDASGGPALIRRHARRTARSGDELIAATIVMEEELNTLQEQYLADMAAIESREAAVERQQREQEESRDASMSPEEERLLELAGLSDEEQEQRIAQMEQPERDSLLATLDGMIQEAPDEGTAATEGTRLRVDTGLSQAIMGEQPADPRAQQIQEVENRRVQRVGGVLDIADQNMTFLTVEQQRMLANRLVAESVVDDVKNIDVLQMGQAMIEGMIDPRQSLTSVIGGFEKMATGIANIGNIEAWRKDPLGNLLQIAADISTGLAMIFSTILGLAAIVTAVMVALTIISWGVLSPVTAPVIGWMGTIMTYAGWGAIIAGSLSVYFNYLSYIKNLHDAGTAETARELFGNTEQMRQNATDGFQGAMAVVEGVGAVKMGPALSSGRHFARVPRSPGAWARQTVQGAREGVHAIAGAGAAVGRGARRLLSGGRAGLRRFKTRMQRLFARRRPGDVDFDTAATRRRRQADLDESRDMSVEEMDGPHFRAEMDELAEHHPRAIEAGSRHFDEYDVEIHSNGHTYRRRRDGRGWCRFSETPKDCGIGTGNMPPEVRDRVGHLDESGDLARQRGVAEDFAEEHELAIARGEVEADMLEHLTEYKRRPPGMTGDTPGAGARTREAKLKGEVAEARHALEVAGERPYPKKASDILSSRSYDEWHARLQRGEITLSEFAEVFPPEGVRQVPLRVPDHPGGRVTTRHVDHMYMEGDSVVLRESKDVEDLRISGSVRDQFDRDLWLAREHPGTIVEWRLDGSLTSSARDTLKELIAENPGVVRVVPPSRLH